MSPQRKAGLVEQHRLHTSTGGPQRLQRLRITFSRGLEVKYCSHLDMMRLWERALRRAALPLAFSEGFTPHPQLALAAPLPVGITGGGELMEVYLRKRVSPRFFLEQIMPQLPAGIDISRVEEAPVGTPSLQSLVRMAEYLVEVECSLARQEVEARIVELLAQERLPIERPRPSGPKALDLRALVNQVWVESMVKGRCQLGMLLRTDPQGSGRPQEVVAALGLGEPLSMHRVRLMLEEEDGVAP
ncbi:MAG: TIGR03936 family radical SAM-associated protein [Dehalococcoidia bacterium]|nr:TIGR03936 family radical SAM-associated protein [Dehalococcoidia bacterium]